MRKTQQKRFFYEKSVFSYVDKEFHSRFLFANCTLFLLITGELSEWIQQYIGNRND